MSILKIFQQGHETDETDETELVARFVDDISNL